MGASIYPTINEGENFNLVKVMESEGMPELHVGYSTCFRLLEAAGIPRDDIDEGGGIIAAYDCCGTFDAAKAHENFDMAKAFTFGVHPQQVDAFLQICRAVTRVGRTHVTWA